MGTEKAATSCRTLEYKMALREKISRQVADDFIEDCLRPEYLCHKRIFEKMLVARMSSSEIKIQRIFSKQNYCD